MSFIKEYYLAAQNVAKIDIDWNGISQNQVLTLDDVNNNPEFPWNYIELLQNHKIIPLFHNFPIVLGTMIFNILSYNPVLSWEYVELY